jgi:hypothetical protein
MSTMEADLVNPASLHDRTRGTAATVRSSHYSRPHFCLALVGLSHHDEMVFRSILKAYEGRTRQDWRLASVDSAHVVITSAESDQSSRLHASRQESVRIIRASRNRQPGESGLALPFRARDVLQELDSTGDALEAIAAQVAVALAVQPPTPAAAFKVTDTQQTDSNGSEVFYGLKRWPSADLLSAHRANARLAAALSGKAITINKLSQRTGVDLDQCRTFVEQLRAQRILVTGDAGATSSFPRKQAVHTENRPAPTAALPATPSGLFARIRARLGLNSARGASQ